MTLDEVKAAVQQIRELAGDDEVAHGTEYDLYASVLSAIADGTVSGADAAALASEALKTQDIDFARWCA